MENKISLYVIKNWQYLTKTINFTDVAASMIENNVITVDEFQLITNQPVTQRTENFLLLVLKKKEETLVKVLEVLKRDYGWLATLLPEDNLDVGYDEVDTSVNSIQKNHGHGVNENMPSTHNNHHNFYSNNFHQLNNHRENTGRKKSIKLRTKNKFQPYCANNSLPFTANKINQPLQPLNEEITDEVISIMRKNSMISKSWTTLAHAFRLTEKVHEIRHKVVVNGEDLGMCTVYLMKEWLESFPEKATLSQLINTLRGESFNSAAVKLEEILYGKKINT